MYYKILDLIKRQIIPVAGFISISLMLWVYYGSFFWNIVFALIVATYSESIALLVSSLSCFVYTEISPSEMSEELKGKIFLAVHVLFAIIVGLIYWSKLGG